MSGLSLLLPDYIYRDLHRRNRSSVLKPVCGVPILGPAHSRPIVRSDSISMVSDRSLQYVDGAWSVFMVVDRAEDASRLDGHHTHSKLAPCHALDLRAKVNRCKVLHRNIFRLRCRLFIAHCALLSVLLGREYSSTSGCDCACTLVIHDNDAIRGDFAFRYLERRRDPAIGKQTLSNAQRYRIYHQPERIDQIMLHERLNENTTSPNVQIRPLLLLD